MATTIKIKLFSFILILLMSDMTYSQIFHVAYQKGTVEFLRENKPISPPIYPGDIVKVYKKSIVILKSEKLVLKLLSNTTIKAYQDSDKATTIELVKGALFSRINKSNYKVKTTHTTMGVRGTEFFVELNSKDDNSWMCVREGSVEVTQNDHKNSVLVPQGKGVFIEKSKIGEPKYFEWTKKINWEMDDTTKELDQNIELKSYDPLNNLYD